MISATAQEAIKGATTAVDSFKAVIAALAEDQTITQNTAGIVNLALSEHADVIEPLVRENLSKQKPAS